MAPVKERLRAWLPRPLWVLLRRMRNYARRLVQWAQVLAELRGDGAGEAAKLYLGALAAPVTALRGLDEWRNPELLFDTRVRVPGSGRFDCRRAADDLFHVLPSGQLAVRAALLSRLRPGGVFIDAGANIGAFTVLGARLVGREGQVIAVEMMPETAARLRTHLRMNGLDWVEVVEQALSDRADEELVARAPRLLAGQASVVRESFGVADLVEHPVRTTTLDDVARGLARVDLMKIDIEGAEARALAGGRGTLARTRAVVFESWSGSGEGKAAEDYLAGLGFTLRRIDGNNVLAVR